ncbi:hypothetical protein V5E97_00645 [Singulisphaera sp. Ch08]|uniref:Uncharacterized protein n=1 Tax=Singulisphaera sp. Ch08 TaxID=3120278 RepID=A0AAU7CH55_9BACT
MVGAALPLSSGCSKSQPLPPTQLTEPQVIKSTDARPATTPSPKVTIISPEPDSHVKKGDPIACKVRVETQPPGRLPEVVNIYFRRGKKAAGGGFPAKVLQQDANSATLALELATPVKPGRYSLVAEALETLVTEPSRPNEKTIFEKRRTYSLPVDFSVDDSNSGK